MLDALNGSMATLAAGCDGPVQLAPPFVDLYKPPPDAAMMVEDGVLMAMEPYQSLSRPLVSSLQDVPASVVLKMRPGAPPAYNTALFDGSMSNEPYAVGARPRFAGLQCSPPSVDLNTPRVS
jgi:hypothetical protein